MNDCSYTIDIISCICETTDLVKKGKEQAIFFLFTILFPFPLLHCVLARFHYTLPIGCSFCLFAFLLFRFSRAAGFIVDARLFSARQKKDSVPSKDLANSNL